jgi:hypothetical protein
VKLWLAKVRRDDKVGLIPTDDESRAALGRMGDGECAEVELIRPRSLQWHRMYFGICRIIGQNQDPTRGEDSIDAELRVLAGHYDVLWVDGHEVRVPRRIAFAKLSGDQWAELWPSLEMAIREKYGEEYLRESARTGTW